MNIQALLIQQNDAGVYAERREEREIEGGRLRDS